MIGGGSDVQMQNLIVDAQQRATQQTPGLDDGQSDADRKAAEKRLAIKVAGLQKQVAGETFDRKNGTEAKFTEALSGRPDLQKWATDPQLQNKLTPAQQRSFVEAVTKRGAEAPRAAGGAAQAPTDDAAAAINRLASSPSFRNAVQTTGSMGEVHQAIGDNPRLAGPLQQNVLDSRFMQSPKADPATKADFLRFGLQNMQKGNLQSVKVAGDMLGSLAGTQTPALGQRAAMKMAQRDPTNETGMKNIDGFVQEPRVRGMPSMARGRATEVLARADGHTDVRSGLESVAQDPTFTGLGREDKARVFSTIGQGRTSDFRAITDKVLLTLQSTDFPARQQQVSRLLTQMASQVKQSGADGISPKHIIRSAKKSSAPNAPTLVSTANIDPEDEEAMTKARSQNRASVMKYYNQMAGSHDEVGDKLEGAKYFEDVSMLSGLRPSEELDTSALSVDDAFRGALSEHLDSLKQGMAGGNQQVKKQAYADGLKTLAQDMAKQLGRPLTTDEGTLVLAQGKQAQTDLRFNDLTRQKNQRMRELRGQRMPPAKRQAQAAERRVVGEQPQYFSPGASRAARGAFTAPVTNQRNALPQGPGLGRLQQNTQNASASQSPALPRSPGLPQNAGAQRGQARSQAGGAAGAATGGVPRQGMLQQAPRAQGATLGNMRAPASVDEEVQQLMGSLDASLSPVAKMAQAKQIMAEKLQHHIDVASRMMLELMADPQTTTDHAVASQQSQPGQSRTPSAGPVQPQSLRQVAPSVGGPAQQATGFGAMMGQVQDMTSGAGATHGAGVAEAAQQSDGPPAQNKTPDAQVPVGQQTPLQGPQGSMPKSLDAVEAIGQERPRGAAAKLAAMVSEAGATAQNKAGISPSDMARSALGALGVNLADAGQPAPSASAAPQAPPTFASAALSQVSPQSQPQTVQGKTDGWGIPRTFERDLGATGAPTVRPSRQGQIDDGADAGASATMTPERYTGRTMVKSSTPVRDVATLQQTPWKQLSQAEAALLKNLGWSQKTWDTQTQPKTQWPRSMSTPYQQLSAKHREAVKRLGLSAAEWDDVVSGSGADSSGGSHR